MSNGKKIGYQMLGVAKVLIPIGAFIGGVFAMALAKDKTEKKDRILECKCDRFKCIHFNGD